LRRPRADGILRGYFEVEVAVEADLSPITPIMRVLLWRRPLYGSWRYYAITVCPARARPAGTIVQAVCQSEVRDSSCVR